MSKGGGKLGRFIRAPIRALSRARDFYVSSMNGCAARVPYGGTVNVVPRSYSVASQRSSISGDEDLRELIRAVSQGRAGGGTGIGMVARSQSVAVGRIDEEQPCESFGDDVRVGSSLLFPRSRSYAVGGRGKRRVGMLAG